MACENECINATNCTSSCAICKYRVGKNTIIEGKDAEMLYTMMASFKKFLGDKRGSKMHSTFTSSMALSVLQSYWPKISQPQIQALLLILFWQNLMLVRGRSIFNSWKKNFLFTSIQSSSRVFCSLLLDTALTANLLMNRPQRFPQADLVLMKN